nr:transcriptional regulator [Halorussus ruber]
MQDEVAVNSVSNMTTLHVTVGNRAKVRENTFNFIQYAKEDELEESDERAVLQFGTYDEFVDSLTPLRLELIKAIANEQPESMREATRLVDRDVSDVHSDLKHLEVLGILGLKEGGPGGAIQPIVPFDKIEMHIDYPLLEDGETESTPASAD